MKYSKLFLILASILILGISSLQAGMLEKRHQIELKAGMWNQVTEQRTEILPLDISTTVEGNGFLGGISYNYWLQENLAIGLGVGVLNTDMATLNNLLNSKVAASYVSSVTMNLKYVFLRSSLTSAVKPFVRAGVGTFIGHQDEIISGLESVVASRSEMVMGGQLGAGVDFMFSRYFMSGVTFGYNLMTDFDEPIGGSKNYSGPEFAFTLSLVLGKGVN